MDHRYTVIQHNPTYTAKCSLSKLRMVTPTGSDADAMASGSGIPGPIMSVSQNMCLLTDHNYSLQVDALPRARQRAGLRSKHLEQLGGTELEVISTTSLRVQHSECSSITSHHKPDCSPAFRARSAVVKLGQLHFFKTAPPPVCTTRIGPSVFLELHVSEVHGAATRADIVSG